jgi:hypothetical protein
MAREYIKNSSGVLTPIADTQGIVKTTSYMVPDYTNADSTNRWSSPSANSTYTVTQMGFAWISTFKNNDVDGYIQVYFNGRPIHIVGMTGGTKGGLGHHAIAPVKPGDVINSVFSSGVVGTANCRFIPPMFVTPPVPVVEYGTDYTLDEQPVMVNDGTVVRQKKWINGKLIYRRTYYGSVTYTQIATTDATIIHEAGFADTKRLISANQTFYTGNGSQYATQNANRTTHRTDSTAFTDEPVFVSKIISCADTIGLRTNIKGKGWSDGYGIEVYLTVEYWKTTD